MAAEMFERYRPIDGVPSAAAYVDAQGVILTENDAFRTLRASLSMPRTNCTLPMLFVEGDREIVRGVLAGARSRARRLSRPLMMLGSDTSIVAEFIPITRKTGRTFWQIVLRSCEHGASASELASRAAVTAGIVHDLRTPVQVVLGWASLLRRKLDDPECIEHALRMIERNAGQMIGLLEDLLDQTKPSSSACTPARHRPIDLVELVTSEVRSVQPMAEETGVHISVALSTPTLAVAGDDVQLRRVVMNLLGNALKFTPRSGRIECRLWRAGGSAALAVTDNGPGIPREFLTRVFDPYVQGPGQRLETGTGLGLGLAVVRHIVELHGGTVSASSDGPGSGATFTVLLPLDVSMAVPFERVV